MCTYLSGGFEFHPDPNGGNSREMAEFLSSNTLNQEIRAVEI